MEEKTNKILSDKYGLQDYLSLGYIYLIILGLIDSIVYYKFLDINILSYLPITDVLLIPINTLTRELRVLGLFIVVGIGVYYYIKFMPSYMLKRKDNKWFRIMNLNQSPEKMAQKLEKMKENIPFAMAIYMTLVFFGFNLGKGAGTKNRIEKGEMTVNRLLTFNDNTTKRVSIIGQNSSYLFFIPEGEKEITIMPISSYIRAIKNIN